MGKFINPFIDDYDFDKIFTKKALEEDPVQHLFQHQERVDDGRDE